MSEKTSENEIVEKLKSEHGERIVYAKTPMGLVACRPPTVHEHQRISDKYNDPKASNFSAQKEYIYGCRIHPERADFVSIMEAYPGLIVKFTDALADAAGADIEISTGK